MKTLVILGEISMAEIWTYEAQGACKHLVPVPCREYVRFIDVKG